MDRRLVVGLLAGMATLWGAPPALASSVAGLTVDNASPTQAAGARTVYTIDFTTTAAIPTLGTITVTLPVGTDFAGYNDSSVVVGGATIGACGGANTQTFTVTCSLFSGNSIPAAQDVAVTLNGVANSSTAGDVTVATTGDTDPAATAVGVTSPSPVGDPAVDNTSVTRAAGARTVYAVTFTTSSTGGLANAANSTITLTFPSGTGFDGYNDSSVVDTTAGSGTIGSCGGANLTTRTVTCGLFNGNAIPASHNVRVTLNGVANPPADGTVTLSTSSDTPVAPGFSVLPNQPLTGAAVDNASPTRAAGARTVYAVTFTTSSTGGLANAANSTITLTFPSGTGFDGYNDSSVVDTTAGSGTIGSCGGANLTTRTVTCGLFNGNAIPASHNVRVTLNGVANPPADGTVTLSTSSDTPVAPAFSVVPAQALSGVTTTVGSAAPGAGTAYTIAFTTSPVGALTSAANSVITLVFPAGTGFAGYNDSSVVDATAGGGAVGSCGGANLTTRTVACGLFNGNAIPAGHAVRVTLSNLTNPAGGGPYTVGASTTSDPGAPGPGGGQGTPTPTPTRTPTPTPPPVQTPTPTPIVMPAPTPTPTATPVPTPVAGRSVVAAPVRGKVKVRLPGTNRFVDLDTTRGVPLGATVDATHGTIRLTSRQTRRGKPQTADFHAGRFKVTQTKRTTDLTLNQPLAACRKKGHASAAAKKKKQPKTRRLWGSGHGSFRTKGRYSAATVRGTKWLVQDSCDGTLTRVARGVVSVRDDVRHKTITLRAGKRYLARPRR